MEKFEDNNGVNEERSAAPTFLERLSELMDEQTRKLNANAPKVPRLNAAEKGYNPSPAELAAVFEGIKAELRALGK